MRFNQEEFEQYIEDNYSLLFKGDVDRKEDLAGSCEFCEKDVFLKVYQKSYNITFADSFPYFEIFHIECPNCRRKSFLHAVKVNHYHKDEDGEQDYDQGHEIHHYRLFNIPDKEYSYEMSDIPEEQIVLRSCISEAMFCMNHSKYASATIMFRRAIQIIAHNILGAPKGTLASQLKWLKENDNQLDIDLTDVFHDNSKIIKDIGNQGAHPEDDISLQTFSPDEMKLLHDLFQSTITEVFIKPARMKQIQDELKSKRKIK